MFQLRVCILSVLLSYTNLCQIEIPAELTIKIMKQLNKHQKDILVITHGLSHAAKYNVSKRLSVDGFEFRFANTLNSKSSQSFVILDESVVGSLVSRMSLVQHGLILVKNQTQFNPDFPIEINQEIYFYDRCHQRIYEKYFIGRPQIITKFLSNVSSNGQIQSKIPSKLKRRSNFLGASLKALTFIYDLKDGYDKNSTKTFDATEFLDHSEQLTKILKSLESSINFSTTVFANVNYSVGYINGDQENAKVTNGSLIDRITKNEADFLLGFYSMLPERRKLVDYMFPLSATKAAFFVKKQHSSDDAEMMSIFHPFSWDTWLALVSILAFSITLLVVIIMLKNVENGKSINILSISGLLMSTILWSIYQSQMTAETSIKWNVLPFDNLESLSQSGFKILTPPDTSPLTGLIKTATKNSVFYKLQKNPRLAYGWGELEKQLNQLSKSDMQTVFEEKSVVLDSLDPRICQISIAWESKSPTLYASMIVPKGSPYLEFFNYAILKMIDDGRLSKLKETKRLQCEDQQSGTSNSSKKFLPLFGILVLGIFMGTICFLFEIRQPKWFDLIVNSTNEL